MVTLAQLCALVLVVISGSLLLAVLLMWYPAVLLVLASLAFALVGCYDGSFRSARARLVALLR